jgi:hypothetical protein
MLASLDRNQQCPSHDGGKDPDRQKIIRGAGLDRSIQKEPAHSEHEHFHLPDEFAKKNFLVGVEGVNNQG